MYFNPFRYEGSNKEFFQRKRSFVQEKKLKSFKAKGPGRRNLIASERRVSHTQYSKYGDLILQRSDLEECFSLAHRQRRNVFIRHKYALVCVTNLVFADLPFNIIN